MAIEPVNERPIFPSLTRLDAVGVGHWSVSMIRQLTTVFQQYGYKLNQTLLDEDLDTEGGEVVTIGGDPVLRDSDLAANGGSIPEVDRTNTWVPAQVFQTAPTATGHPLRWDELAANGGSIPELDRNNLFAGAQSVANPILLDGEVWNTPTLLNGWENYGGSFATAGYRKLPSGLVVIKGLIRNGTTTSGTVLFNLPAGYRPGGVLIMTTLNSSSLGRINIKDDGDVVFVNPSSSANWIAINFSFFADQ